ncbi:MAG: metal-dependent transcriptional regulator [Lachnospiraceae bacterium]|nr:metal-dependent transcriptional regulator [Lachnospiraceae bacterium]
MEPRESAEDYLEAILRIKEKQSYVRSVDVAKLLKVSKPSVTYATKRLRESGLIKMDDNGMLLLTNSGEKIANDIWTRHKTLAKLFKSLGVKDKQALEDACKVEHDLSSETFTAIQKFVDSIDSV